MTLKKATYFLGFHVSSISIISLVLAITSLLFGVNTAHAASVGQVSTGAETACAVADGKVKCWGSNDFGQLGNRTASSSASPVSVYAVKDPAPITPNPCGGWFQPSCDPVAQPSSPLGGRFVEKVSVGLTHACALADAKVYCWGDNSHGQLGNRSNTSSSMPVAVDFQSKDVTPAPVVPNPCGGWFQPSCAAVPQPTRPKSALGSKEVIDIAASEYFTCALASDGTVACWGEGENGRLGLNNISDINYPKAVNGQGDFKAKKGIRIARSQGAVMCVIAETSETYCWGKGVGTGSLPTNKTEICSESEYERQTDNTKLFYFDALQPRKVPNVPETFNSFTISGTHYISALAKTSRAYYWGMHGYKEHEYTTDNKCVNKSKKGGKSKITHPGCGAHRQGCGGGQKTVYTYETKTDYDYIGNDSPQGPVYSGATSDSPLNRRPLIAISGNVFNGLSCAVITAGIYCDAHGTDSTQGQTGSGGYTPQCTKVPYLGIFTQTICVDPRTGPQKVVDDNLRNKQITDLDTSSFGYSCTIANGEIYCWGINNKGQLGVGDTNNRDVPVKVRL